MTIAITSQGVAPPLLAVTGLVKTFSAGGRPPQRLHAVDGVDFTLARGQALGLVGESGCGKSTLAAMLARLTDPDRGRILFDGVDLTAVPARRAAHAPWRRRIQMVFQDAGDSLDPRLTAIEAVARPLARLNGLKGAALTRAAAEALDRVYLPASLFGRLPHQLSGGQLARVGLARAIAPGPELLILDEPTSALDVSIQAVILRLIDDLRRELGLACLFVSHDLNVVRMMCGQVLVMYLGRVVEQGPADAVFDHPAHPYTAGLAAAIPRLDGLRHERGTPVARRMTGEPMSPIDPDPDRCRFDPRCPLAVDLCRQRMPVLTPQASAPTAPDAPPHLAACHLAGGTGG
ncbi:ABC transporter ATP-binding protein [Tistrella bauzanensis]|uniref:ABC transporter ATP-binding protein n=1 Tax=Tistrella bauzanensis TaxID=657419 RepID=A0ABQ1I8W0_9PROT|nr:ABC transporter ATP-binding protein [Tistrella bauzanensis]GGB28246.1 ABC transporter ATP-binding protein [Tistrella bauzanensis]